MKSPNKHELVKPKKKLGQHFLKDQNIAEKITSLLSLHMGYSKVLEIGAGMGVLTQFLVRNKAFETYVIDIDTESIEYLKKAELLDKQRIIEGDFLRFDLVKRFPEPLALIGNLPYNISSPIFFEILAKRNHIPEAVFMIQKEVAQRICSKHGSKEYGILSVLLQAFYDLDYCFTVAPHVFVPPPKVQSGVIRLRRNATQDLGCNEKLFFQVVKMGFNQRRKTLRNALRSMGIENAQSDHPFFDKRAEQLSVADFVELTKLIEEKTK